METTTAVPQVKVAVKAVAIIINVEAITYTEGWWDTAQTERKVTFQAKAVVAVEAGTKVSTTLGVDSAFASLDLAKRWVKDNLTDVGTLGGEGALMVRDLVLIQRTWPDSKGVVRPAWDLSTGGYSPFDDAASAMMDELFASMAE